MTKRVLKSSRPKIPLHALVQEAFDLKCFCNNDRAYLADSNFDWSMIDSLEKTAKVCARAEAVWVAAKADCKVKTERLNKLACECRKERSFIAQQLRSAVQVQSEKIKLPWYSLRHGCADIVQDIFDLFACCKKRQEILPKAGFDMSVAERAKEKALELTKLVALNTNESAALSQELKARDLVFNELDSMASAVRKLAIFSLSGYPERAVRYRSEFYCEQNRRRPERRSKNAV